MLYPFGNNTVVMGDMKHQYIALMTYFKNNITHLHNFLCYYVDMKLKNIAVNIDIKEKSCNLI